MSTSVCALLSYTVTNTRLAFEEYQQIELGDYFAMKLSTWKWVFAQVRVELPDGFPEAIEDGVVAADRNNVHIAELLGISWVIRAPRQDPQP